MIITSNNLVKRDSKDKIRLVKLFLNEHVTDDQSVFYSITGRTGIFQGKMVPRPLVTIDQGKVKRTVLEQAKLQYNSLLSSYKDKGYKDVVDLNILDLNDIKEVESKVPKEVVDQNGSKKPMLALSYEKVNSSLLEQTWFSSKKLDGVRAFLFMKDGIIQTASRGGQDYNIAAYYIIHDPFVEYIFKNNPNYILDGELYIHGKPLSYISGLCRLKTLDEKHRELTFQCYDIVREDLPFKQRLNILHSIEHSRSVDSLLEIVYHTEVKGKKDIMDLHDRYVELGYEGAVLRDPETCYKCGARDKRMLKIKIFEDSEFQIVGITNGLREEDFVFNLVTKEGYPFEAKPIGDRAMKKWYRNNIDQLIGQMATVKYFGYTTTERPVPNLPVLKSIRTQIDM